VEQARAIDGVHTVIVPDVGEQTHRLRSSWDRPVLVTARGTTPGAALGAARQAVQAITITTTAEPPEPTHLSQM
jgi:hypothetical protein